MNNTEHDWQGIVCKADEWGWVTPDGWVPLDMSKETIMDQPELTLEEYRKLKALQITHQSGWLPPQGLFPQSVTIVDLQKAVQEAITEFFSPLHEAEPILNKWLRENGIMYARSNDVYVCMKTDGTFFVDKRFVTFGDFLAFALDFAKANIIQEALEQSANNE